MHFLALLLVLCFRNIFRNRLRSFLTALGIIIGVGSVITMVAIGTGAQREIEERITAMGTNLIQIMPRRMLFRPGQGNTTFSRPNRLTQEDAQKLKAEASYIKAFSAVTQRTFTVSGLRGSWSVTVMGVEPDYLTIRNWNLLEGICFDTADLTARNRVAVLGLTTATNLFAGAQEALGERIRIGSNHFTVIGVLEKKGVAGSGNDQDDVILAPLDTVLTRLSNTRNISLITMQVARKEYMDAAQKEADLILRELHHLSERDNGDFEIINQAEIIDMASETSRSLTTLLAAIAGVSLVVGGIGIMNIMLVSVTERTREIGIRMAVGARKGDILVQFLLESIVLSLLGGLVGIGLGLLVSRILNALQVPTGINPLVVMAAALVAALEGVAFGYYPARKAARLYPIEALRYE
ncbi:MAG: ABC transporter permease [Treponema sp.]|nr:ABC transporter permease [Treponema sp.]